MLKPIRQAIFSRDFLSALIMLTLLPLTFFHYGSNAAIRYLLRYPNWPPQAIFAKKLFLIKKCFL
jgi:hypothetical protein